jgi:Ras family protein
MVISVERKLAVLGFRSVGKTALSTQFVEGRFVEDYEPTIENIHHKTIKMNQISFVTDVVDTAGMVSYRRWSPVICDL